MPWAEETHDTNHIDGRMFRTTRVELREIIQESHSEVREIFCDTWRETAAEPIHEGNHITKIF